MRLYITIAIILISLGALSQKNSFARFGLDYRQYPIDIEDVPQGPYHSNASPSSMKFWQVFSIHGAYGFRLDKNWSVSISSYARYNHFHWVQGYNYVNPRNIKEKKNFKYDIFCDFEKKVRLRKNKEQYIFGIAGIGITNINTRFDIFLQDTLPSGPTENKHYKGTYTHLSPRISLGYQYEKIKGSLDAYIIEGPDLTNLTSLWLGATVSYEITFKKSK